MWRHLPVGWTVGEDLDQRVAQACHLYAKGRAYRGLEPAYLAGRGGRSAHHIGRAFDLGEQLASIPFDDPWDTSRAEAWWNANVPDNNNDVSTGFPSDTMVWNSDDTE